MRSRKKRPTSEGGFWSDIIEQFLHHRLGVAAGIVMALFILVGIYAPFLASGKPIVVRWHGEWYFPLFRYLFFPGYYSTLLDRFFNLLMFTFPIMVGAFFTPKPWRYRLLFLAITGQLVLFLLLVTYPPLEPDAAPQLRLKRMDALKPPSTPSGMDPILAPLPLFPTWTFDLQYMNRYAKLNLVLDSILRQKQHTRLAKYQEEYGTRVLERWLDEQVRRKRVELLQEGKTIDEIPSFDSLRDEVLEQTDPERLRQEMAIPSPWRYQQDQQRDKLARLHQRIETLGPGYMEAIETFRATQEFCRTRNAHLFILPSGAETPNVCSDTGTIPEEVRQQFAELRQTMMSYEEAQAQRQLILQRTAWLKQESKQVTFLLMPLLRPYHWEEDAGGEQALNRYVHWWELTRPGRKDLAAALIFGIRISLVVGLTAVGLALCIGIPVGAFAGYYGGKSDIIVCRLMEIWESMPTFFMLLLIVGVTQSKSIFLVIAVIGLFGWTGFSRFLRGEFLKQRNLPYTEACRSMGFRDRTIMFGHVLPNAIPPLLTLLPFAIMGAVTTEAGLSFLGLGEEGSCSWGVLMDEGRRAFPGESYLLWPPAILLTTLLVAIALIGDALRDALDPRLRS